jgi:cobalt/nickel transport system permease protein
MTSFVSFFEIFAITQIPLAVAEGVLFVMFFDYLSRVRPDVLKGRLYFKGKASETPERTVEA